MISTRRLALAPVLALMVAGFPAAGAHATTDQLSVDSVDAQVLVDCQPDPDVPRTLDELAPVVVGESDVTVVPGEITAHVVRVDVTDGFGDTQECTFGALHRDVQLPGVQYEGTATLALGDGTVVDPVDTDIELGDLGLGSVDPTSEVVLDGFLVPLDAVEDPSYTISMTRTAREVVHIAVKRTVKDAAAHLLKKQLKAASQLQKKLVKAAEHKHSAEAVAAANHVYAKRVAAAQAAYDRATKPKTVTRPVSHDYDVSGSVALLG